MRMSAAPSSGCKLPTVVDVTGIAPSGVEAPGHRSGPPPGSVPAQGGVTFTVRPVTPRIW